MRNVGLLTLLAFAMTAPAQDIATPAQAAKPAAAAEAPSTPAPLITTLEEVRALPPDEEQLDLYKFDNPIKVDPNTFSKSYHPPPSPKEISENGGYLLYGVAKLIGAVAKALPKVPGVRGQVQPAVARPPPLDAEQMNRAARISGQGAITGDESAAGSLHD